jgi:hypothetical protein
MYVVVLDGKVIARNLHTYANAQDWIDENLTGTDWTDARIDIDSIPIVAST